jgi:hypothetical protein
MTRNIGNVDRIIRVILGIALVALGIYLGTTEAGTLALVLPIVIGAILLLTAAINFCPIWAVLGIRTLRRDN